MKEKTDNLNLDKKVEFILYASGLIDHYRKEKGEKGLTRVENLEEFFSGRTVIIVAHRLSTVKNADKIIVIEDGKVLQRGAHESLINKEGYYKELYIKQLSEKEI